MCIASTLGFGTVIAAKLANEKSISGTYTCTTIQKETGRWLVLRVDGTWGRETGHTKKLALLVTSRKYYNLSDKHAMMIL